MSGLPAVNYDDNYIFTGTAPHIQVLKADGTPNKYYFLADGYYEDNGEDAYKQGWCDNNGNIVNLVITPGVGFWLKNGSSKEETMIGNGKVSLADSTEVLVPANIFSINANVYPITINLNNANQVSFPGIVGVDYDDAYSFTGTAPHIQIVKADGTADKYYYLNDGYAEVDGQETYNPGWCDSNGNIVEVKIEAQNGFWVKGSSGAFTINYKK